MIFSAAALTVKLNIFLPMPTTSMRRLAPSCAQVPAPSNSEAVACPAAASADRTACRTASTVGAVSGLGGLANESCLGESAKAGVELAAAGKGVADALIDGGSEAGSGADAGSGISATADGVRLCSRDDWDLIFDLAADVGADIAVFGVGFQPPVAGPNGECDSVGEVADGDAAGPAEDVEDEWRAGPAEARGVEAGVELRTPDPPATPLSSSSRGRRRWA